jgi:outer membrane autotransporter protein
MALLAAVVTVPQVAQAQTPQTFLSAVGATRDGRIPIEALLCGAAAAGSEILSSSEASNSIFLTQSTAFVSAPPDPKPDSQGGGVWVRGAGGEVRYSGDPTFSTPTASVSGQSLGCPSGFQQSFGGFQVGQDIAKLNLMGWNIHVGQTAGYVGSDGHSTDGNGATLPSFTTATQIPFVGAYAAATNGGFFVDGLVRFNWIENSINSPAIGLTDRKLDAHGVSASGSAGYHWNVPGSAWFIEPSIAGIWSRTSIDPLNVTLSGVIDSTIQFNTIDSFIGRAGVRFGTTMQSGNLIYQPFVALSAWHEFGDDVHATFTDPTQTIGITLPNIGTYGQYSVGVNAQIANTGWLGYARVDYRNGDHIEGWSGTGGIRYQFTPDPDALVKGYYKAPVKAPVSAGAPNWTGFYIGAFAGADYGSAKIDFPGIGAAGPQVAGALVGGTLGYNWQFGSWVLGVEGDAGWTNARGSVACSGALSTPGGIGGFLAGTDCADRADFLATATARLGYAWGRALYYAKAGGAWTHETFTVTCNNLFGSCNGGPAAGAQSVASDDRAGWTIGYGVEFALTANWSAKGEVSYIDFGNKTMTASDGTTVLNAGMRITEGKIGVNYKF